MKNKSRHIDSREFFTSLTRNAIDFLEKSIAELDQSPKYSVIHFCAAVELFLKARLLVEHWSLIVSKSDQANLTKFKAGDFHSVTMQEAISRLKNISLEKIGDKAESTFEVIRQHRNKLVHFFHKKYLTKPDSTTLEEVVPEQYSAWFHLHYLISKKWKSIFGKYQKNIEKLDHLMHRHREYLSAKFDVLKDEIEKVKRDGAKFNLCFFCGFISARVDDSAEPLLSNNCFVCKRQYNFLIVSCPECDSNILIEDMGVGKCDKCGYKDDLDFLISELGPYEDPKEERVRAYCANCEYTAERTVIPFNGNYLCLYCLETFGATEPCEWCNELIAGMDMEGSYFTGCVLCDGRGDRD